MKIAMSRRAARQGASITTVIKWWIAAPVFVYVIGSILSFGDRLSAREPPIPLENKLYEIPNYAPDDGGIVDDDLRDSSPHSENTLGG